jgi:hypothetical protein
MTMYPKIAGLARRSRTLALMIPLLLVAMGAFAIPALSRNIQAAGSKVMLDVPNGFVPATQFSGFTDPKTNASIVILDMPPQAFVEMSKDPDAAKGLAFAQKGIKNIVPAELKRPDKHFFFRGEQETPAGDYAKFMLIFGSADGTAVISVNVPNDALVQGTYKAADFETMLTTAAIAATAAATKDLFKLEYLGAFKSAGRLAGTALIYSLDGKGGPDHPTPPKQGEKPAARPAVIIAPSYDKREIKDMAAFSRMALGTMIDVTSAKIMGSQAAVIDGLDAYELTAAGRDLKSGNEIAVHQVVLTKKDGTYYRFVGLAPANEAATYLEEFKKIANSFKLAE